MAGFGLNLKLILYLQNQCLTQSLGFLNQPLLQAAKRQAVKKPLFPIEIFKLSYSTIKIKPFKKLLFLSC
jgi:hypothetical protein